MHSKNGTGQPHLPVAALVAAALGLATLLVAGGEAARGSGVTGHTWIGGEATQHVTNEDLRGVLQARQLTYYGQGLSFPDNLGIVELLDGPRLEGHGDAFLNNYLAWIRILCGPDPDPWLDVDWCGDLLAHFMGSLGHDVGDFRFDRYYLMRVSEVCGPDGPPPAYPSFEAGGTDWAEVGFGGGPGCSLDAFLSGNLDLGDCLDWENDPPQSQGFTDLWVDAVLSPLEPDKYRPTLAWIPDTGCADPGQCTHPINQCALVDALEATFPEVPWDICYVQGLANIGQIVFPLHLGWAFLVEGVNNMCPGRWAIANVQTNYGGVQDSGEVLADYINKTWEILQSGNVPVFEKSACWGRTAETLSVRANVPNAPRFDYASWIEVTQGVSKFQLSARPGGPDGRAINRIGALLFDGTLKIHDGPFDRVNGSLGGVNDVASGVVDFQLDGDRIAALHENGDLMVKENLLADWVTVAPGVSEFRLEGSRIAALLEPPPGETVPTLLVKDGTLDTGWGLRMTAPIEQFELEADRIGVLTASELLVKEGALDAAWASIQGEGGGGSIDQFQLVGDRIWILDRWPGEPEGELFVKEGPLDGGKFVPQLNGVSQFRVDGDVAGALVNDQLWLQDGSIFSGWNLTVDDAAEFEVQDIRKLLPDPDIPLMTGLFMHRSAADGLLYTGDTKSLVGPCVEGLPHEGVIADFQMEGRDDIGVIFQSRVGVLVDDTLYVKQWYGRPGRPRAQPLNSIADINGDGGTNVLDLMELLLCWGQPAAAGCETADINQDGTVDVLDLIELLLQFS